MWVNLPAQCPGCGSAFTSGVVAEQFAQLVVVQRQPTSSAIGRCPRCGAPGRLTPRAEEAVQTVISPERSADDRERLISALAHDDGAEEIAVRAPMFARLRSLLPRTRSDRIAFASLLVSIAALANDVDGRWRNAPASSLRAEEPPRQDPSEVPQDSAQQSPSHAATCEISGVLWSRSSWDERTEPVHGLGRTVDGNPTTAWESEIFVDEDLSTAPGYSSRYEIKIYFRGPVRLTGVRITHDFGPGAAEYDRSAGGQEIGSAVSMTIADDVRYTTGGLPYVFEVPATVIEFPPLEIPNRRLYLRFDKLPTIRRPKWWGSRLLGHQIRISEIEFRFAD